MASAGGKCLSTTISKSRLDWELGERFETSAEKAGWESNFVDEGQRTSRSMFREMKSLGVAVPCWQVPRVADGNMMRFKDTCPEDIKKTSVRLAKDVYLQT